MKRDNKEKEKRIDKRWFLILLVIPFISIVAIILFRHAYNPTNEEIIEFLRDSKAYESEATYKVINSKGEYEENTKIYYGKDLGMRIEFGQERVKIYKDGFISMKDGDETYELEKGMDCLFPLAFPNNLLSYDIKSIEEGQEEWGDTKYLEVIVEIPGINEHVVEAKLYINKKYKSPILLKIYDNKENERVIIVYNNFKFLDEVDEAIF